MRRFAWGALVVAALLVGGHPALAQRGEGTATLVLESQPAGAEVLIDAKEQGPAPRSVDVTPGSHKVQFVKDGFEPYEKKITVKAGEKLRLRGTLRAAAVKAAKPAPAARPEKAAPAAKVTKPEKAAPVVRAEGTKKAAGKGATRPDKVGAGAEPPKKPGRKVEPLTEVKTSTKVKPISKTAPAVDQAKGPRGAEAHALPHADKGERLKAARAEDDPRSAAVVDRQPSPTSEPVVRPRTDTASQARATEPDAAPKVVAPARRTPAAVSAVAPVQPVSAPAVASSGPSLRTIGWIGLGLGAVLTGGAIYTNLLANKKYDSIGKAGRDYAGLMVGMSQVEARSAVDSGNTFRTVSSVLYVIGATSVGVSAFLVAFGDSSVASNGQPAVAVSPIPGGGVVTVQGGF